MVANHEKITLMLKTAKGHIEGILGMIAEDRYCIDIIDQILAVQSLLSRAKRDILTAHLEHCVKDALPGEDAERRIAEVVKLLQKSDK